MHPNVDFVPVDLVRITSALRQEGDHNPHIPIRFLGSAYFMARPQLWRRGLKFLTYKWDPHMTQVDKRRA